MINWFVYACRAVELLSGLAGIYSMEKFGHRATLTGGLVFSGIACLITGVIADGNEQFHSANGFLIHLV